MQIKAPETCICCGSPYTGGHVRPNEPMKPELRVFYQCGASVHIFEYKYRNGVTDGTDYDYAYLRWEKCQCFKCGLNKAYFHKP
jgi:hypothetical protein